MNEKIAQEGSWLTQATLREGEYRIFIKKVTGSGDLDSIFVEWTDEQKEEWENEPLEEEISDTEALNIITGNNDTSE